MAKKANSVANVAGESPVLPRIPLVLDGKKYHLVLSWNAFVHVENLCGINIFEYVDFSNLNATNTRAMLWAALIHENPDITIDEVGVLITKEFRRLREIIDALFKCYVASSPEAKEGEKNENPPKAE